MERSRSIWHGICLCVAAGVLFVHPATSARADVFHVKADAAGAGDGSSWSDAFTDLQFALTVAAMGDEIRVAVGTYRPSECTDPADPRSVTFQLRSGVAIYGGFAGTETSLAQRAGVFEQTILTGDLNADDAPITNPADLPDEPTRAENAYHVVTGSGTDETAILDGFTITAGHADGDFPNDGGGGMLNDSASPSVANCLFRHNAADFGGGMLTRDGAPRISRCTFEHGFARITGGGLHIQSAAPIVEDCTLSDNLAIGGGGVYNTEGSRPVINRCLFKHNAAGFGGAMSSVVGSRPVVVESTFEGNTADQEGGAIRTASGSLTTLTDSAVIGNSAFFGGGMFSIISDTVLTGCTLQDNVGVSEGGGLFQVGGTATLTDCTIRSNRAAGRGGGVFGSGARLEVTGCRISANAALRGAGGVHNDGAPAWLKDCVFTENKGGALSHVTANATVVGCIFVGNSSGVGGSNHSFVTVTNCTIVANKLGSVGGTESSPMVVTNCIVWNNRKDQPGGQQIGDGDNVQVMYSCIQGGFPGEGNIDVDPRFVRLPNDGGDGWADDPRTPNVDEGVNDDFGDLRLQPGSPCIDAGDNDADTFAFDTELQPLPETDFVGNPRFLDHNGRADTGRGMPPIVDMGVFEFALAGDSDFDSDVDLADYLLLARCISGPGVPFDEGCIPADLDLDGDVDLADVVQFYADFTGAR